MRRVNRMVIDQDLYKTRLEFVLKLSLLIRTIKIFNPQNETIDRQLKKCSWLIWTISKKEKRLSLRVLRDSLFVNQERIRVTRDTYGNIKLIIDELKRRMVGEVLFMEGISPGDLKCFLYLLVENEQVEQEEVHKLTRQLIKNNIHSITVKSFDSILNEERHGREEAKKVYFRAIMIAREACENLLADKPLPLRKAKRLVQSMVDLLVADEAALLGLSTIKNYDDYTYNHSVNVSIYSLSLGAKLKLSKRVLAELGLAALLHDLGKVKIPDTILKKPEKLDGIEWEFVRSHPMIGVEEILELRQFAELHPRVLFGIFDHHLNFDASGYPSLKRKKKQTLFGKIIAIADVYDALTTARCYRNEVYSPEDALRLMWRECGAHFDPTLFKVFVNAIGIYPVGTLVQLDSTEVGVVYGTNTDPKLLDRPTVLTINEERAKRGTINLSETDERTGEFKRSIVRCLDPKKHNICVQEYFF
jgi:HD-GYP domain-containing protein (c-di-GMP phosphodiesterase class II)